MLETLTALFQPWADLYAESGWLPTAVITAHVLAMFVAGGIALGADRRVLRATPVRRDTLRAEAAELSGTHRLVVSALITTVITGIALFAADIGTFWSSRVFWAKLIGIVILTVNGVGMRRTEALLLASAGAPADSSDVTGDDGNRWATLQRHARVSAFVWLVVVVLGVVVANL